MLATLYVVIVASAASYGGFNIDSVSGTSIDLATMDACRAAGVSLLNQKSARYETRTAHCIDKQTGEVVVLDKSGTAK